MRRFTGIPLLLLAAASLSAQQTATTPQPPQTYRSGVQIVEVDVRVFDKDGRFVRDLTRDEFEVIENGVPQPLQSLYLVAEPERVGRDVSHASPDAGLNSRATGVASAPQPASARQTWIFLFDLNHLTPGNGFDRARKAVEDFIADRLKDGDLAGVVAGAKMINNRLTSVREELVNAVKTVKPLVETRNRQFELTREWPKLVNEDEALRIAREEREALERAVRRACTEDPKACEPPTQIDLIIKEKARKFVRENRHATMETLTAMNGLASGLARIPGPKTIVFLTDGFVTEEIETTLRNVVGQTARAGGRVYAIDVRGQNRGRSAAALDQTAVTDEAGAFTGFDAGEDGPNSLAIDTGGMMIRNENNIARALDTIARDSGQYYVLGYQPADANFDGKFRPIEVRVKRPDVRVRARRGYLALEPSKMLIPRPITSEGPAAGLPAGARTAKAREGGKPGSPDAGEPGGRGAGAPAIVEPLPADLSAGARNAEVEARSAKVEPPGVTAVGTVVTAPPPASSIATTRLRPNVDETLQSLAGVETAAAAGDLAKKGWDAYQRGDVENALVSFTAAAEQADVRPWVLYALGLSQVALARPLDAAASWERVRTAVPEFEPVYIDLADTYVQLSDLTKALAVLRDAEKRWPTDAEIHNAIGVIHFRRGALDDAIDAFARATAVQPEDALGYYNLGRAYEMRFARGQRYVSSQRKWVAPSQDDRRRAEENYERCVRLGGPYAQDAADAISRLQWSKK